MSLIGRLLLRGEEGYDAACVDRVFNRRLDRPPPAAVLIAATEPDVVRGVQLARERGWQVAVRSGGHSWAQWSVRDDALVIDVGALREITYDDDTGIVSVSPAVQGGAELAPYLETVGGSSPAATARPSGSAGSCCRADRAGTPAAGAGRPSTSTRSTW